ncbi:MAG TPA: lamin tail domain-containing protein [Solirubrobacteraceae bacterium]|nr:lamin tail domain-containing protein [Solirubrobacteraceae bacterium]
MSSLRRMVVAALLFAVVLVPVAAASPSADLDSVVRDYTRHERITPCRFTKAQLEGVRNQASSDVDTYAHGFAAALRAALKHWTAGDCRGKRDGAKLTIVLVHAKGAAGAESITIKNLARRAVNLRGYALRDRGDHTLKFRAVTLVGGDTLRVVTGCRSGHRGVLRLGLSYYACRSKQIWDDAGDLVELLGPGGGLLSKREY